MEQSWQPNPDVVAQAFGLLQALRDPTRPDHHTAITTLTQNATQPLFILHMLHIFAQGYQYESVGLGVDMRQLAGLIIKNYVFPYLPSLTEHVQNLMKNAFLQALHDTIPDIRRTAAILIGRITESYPASFWIEMIPVMVEYLDSKYIQTQPSSVEGNLTALLLLCEDSASKLAHATDGSGQALRPLDALVPKLLELLTVTNDASTRVRILQCYNCLLYLLDSSKTSPSSRSSLQGLRSRNTSMDSERLSSGRNSFSINNTVNSPNSPIVSAHQSAVNISALILHMHAFIQLLAVLAQDPDGSVRKHVLLSITIIAFFHVSLLEPYFPNICEFMLTALGDREESVGIEACEFWHALLASQDTKKAMQPYLPRVLAALITRLRLTDDQMQAERLMEEEEHHGVKQVTFQPFRYRRRQRYFRPVKKTDPNTLNSTNSMANHSNNSPNASNNNLTQSKFPSVSTSEESESNNNHPSSNHNTYEDEDGGEDSEKEKNELSTTWTLRKQAALTLDTFAKAFPPQDILAATLPLIQAYLHPDSRNVTQQLLANLGISVPPATNQALLASDAPGEGGRSIDDSVFLQEAGMLALGCLSEGCLTSMSMYMPQLVPLWCQHIDTSPLPEMRAIVCWVISRYVSLLAPGDGNGTSSNTISGEVWFTAQQAQEMYLSCFQKVLERIFDSHPRVQVAACSALAILLAHAFDITNNNNSNNNNNDTNSSETTNILRPYLPTIFQGLKHALESGRLGVKACLLVVDCVGVISETFAKEDIVQPGHIELLLPNLVQLYLHYDTNVVSTSMTSSSSTLSLSMVRDYQYDARLFPILDCFTSLWPVLGMAGREFVPLLYDKLLTMLRTTLFRGGQSSGSNSGATGFVLPPVGNLSSLRPYHGSTLSGAGGTTQIITTNLHPERDGVDYNDDDVDDDDDGGDDADADDDDLQKDFAICALDVLSALGEGVQGHFASLLTHTYPILLQMLGTSLQDHSRHAHSHPHMKPYQYYLPELIQSTFSMAGELVKQCFAWLVDTPCTILTPEHVVSPPLPLNYLYLLLHFASYHLEQQDYLDYPFLYNNAAWVVGEITLQLLAQPDTSTATTTATAANGIGHTNASLHPEVWIKPFHAAILPALSMAIQTGDIPDTVKMNLAISLGRLTLGGALNDMLEMGVVDDCFAAWCTIFHPPPSHMHHPHHYPAHDLTHPAVQFSESTSSSSSISSSSSPVPLREKLQAFLGILVVVHQYPELIWQNKTNLYAFLCAILSFEHDLVHIGGGVEMMMMMRGDSPHAHVIPYFYPPQTHPRSVSIAEIFDSALWRYLLQHCGESSFPLAVLWGVIQAEMARIFSQGMHLMQQQDHTMSTTTNASASGMNAYGKLWQRVWVSMRQQYDVRFFTQTFGLTL